MKKALVSLLTLAMLMGTMATTALAYDLEVAEEGVFTITDVYGANYYSDGTPDYLCEDTTTITINKDFEVLHIYIFNYGTYTWDEIGLNTTYLDEYIFDSTDFNVTMEDSGMTYTVMDYFDGVADGSIDIDEEYALLAGNAFTALAPLDFKVYISYEDGTYEDCYFSVYSADELAVIDIDEVLVMEIADDDAEEATEEVADEATEEVTEEVADEATEEVTEEVAEEATEEVTEEVAEIITGTTAPSSDTVVVNGQEIAFDAYSINDNNYFKLRDLASVLSGTDKQFEVTWDEDAYAISLFSGEGYTAVGGELAIGDGSEKDYASTTAAVYVDGEAVFFTAYEIDGNNYFKLRDICAAFDIGVTWDEVTETVGIDTSIGYEAG